MTDQTKIYDRLGGIEAKLETLLDMQKALSRLSSSHAALVARCEERHSNLGRRIGDMETIEATGQHNMVYLKGIWKTIVVVAGLLVAGGGLTLAIIQFLSD